MQAQKALKIISVIVFLTVNQLIGQVTTFTYSGAMETYTVPDGITQIEIEVWGAQGGSSTGFDGESAAGGLGGYSKGELSVFPGQVLEIYVGEEGSLYGLGGFNGGGRAGSNYGAEGGGASDVRIAPYGFSNRIIVAGGGGGGSFGTYGNVGGAGGGLVGLAGGSGSGYTAGTGGTQVSGGAAGCCYPGTSSGAFGLGAGTGAYHNAGGGGGWYGGGSGAGYAGAGGGSSYIDGVTDGETTTGVRTGNGRIEISVSCDPLSVIVSDSEICLGEELTLDATSDNGGLITWDGGAVDGVAFTPLTTGVITYTAISDSDEDCWLFVDIEVHELPTVSAAVDDAEICVGDFVVFSESGDADSYVWDPIEVISGDPYAPDIGLVTYTLTGINATTGCENSDAVDVLVHGLPVIEAGEDLAVCIGTEVILTGDGAGLGGSYVWDGGVLDGVSFSPAETEDYTVVGTDVNGCENSDLVEVIVYDLPIIEAGPNDTICYEDEVVLTGSGLDDPDGYFWSDGVLNEIPFNPESTELYYLVGTDENGCVNLDSVWVIVNALPIIDAGEDQAVCLGVEVFLNGAGAGIGGEYVWNEGVLDGIGFTPIETTTYTVIGTDLNGCESEDLVAVEVYELPIIYAGEDQEVCIGGSVVLSAVGAGVDGTYLWEGDVENDVIFEPLLTSDYAVLGTDANGCEDRDTVTVIVHALPIVFAGSDISVCEGDEIILNAVGAGTEGTYNWDNGASNGVSFIPIISDTFIVIGTDENGCENSDTLLFILKLLPLVDAGADQIVCLEEDVTLAVVDKNTDLDYFWDYGVEDGIAFTGSYYENSTIYTVTAVSEENCENTDEVMVDVVNCDTILILPSGFSPNNDGINDYLVFKGMALDDNVYLAVYNEWGIKLFESDDYQNDWDGRNQLGTALAKNRELPVGTYYYILKYGENTVVKNYVYIER